MADSSSLKSQPYGESPAPLELRLLRSIPRTLCEWQVFTIWPRQHNADSINAISPHNGDFPSMPPCIGDGLVYDLRMKLTCFFDIQLSSIPPSYLWREWHPAFVPASPGRYLAISSCHYALLPAAVDVEAPSVRAALPSKRAPKAARRPRQARR